MVDADWERGGDDFFSLVENGDVGLFDRTTDYPYHLDVHFEWHDAKADANLRLHGVSFDQAKSVFKRYLRD